MQFTKIRFSGRTDVDLPFLGLRPNYPYIIKAVDGLGPPEVDIFQTKGVYQGRDPQDRQIVTRVGLNPNYNTGQTAAAMRTTLYGLLTPGPSDSILVKMMNGPDIVAQVLGYVSKLEIVPFSKDPEVQITVECSSSYLSGPVLISSVPSGTSPFHVTNEGTVTTGFYMETTFTANASSWTMWSEGVNTGPRMRIDYAFQDGDKLRIDTRKGRKSINILRGSSTIYLLRYFSSDSVWHQLHPGDNDFWMSPTSLTWGKVDYTPQHWGI